MKKKVVIITGSGSGIGRQVALLCANKSLRIILVGRRPQPLNNVTKLILQSNGDAIAIPTDLRDSNQVDFLIKSTLDRYKRIDILINCAGIAAPSQMVHEIDDFVWNDVIETNLNGYFRMIRAVLPHFISQGSGNIINVASIAGLVGMKNLSIYSITKAAIIALSRSVAIEYGSFGIRCNCVCPGTVKTPMVSKYLCNYMNRKSILTKLPLGKMPSPKQVAQAIYFLISKPAQNITGITLPIDSGFTAISTLSQYYPFI